MSEPALRGLSRRSAAARDVAPVRIVHLGLGSFFRAHQAWYTDHAPDAAQWGIAAFTGRSPAQAEALAPQDGLYTLVTKDVGGDRHEVVASLSAVHPATDHEAFLGYLRSPEVAVVTLTVTEAGYQQRAGGGLDTHRADVAADLWTLAGSPTAPVATVPGRLVAGLLARREAGAGPLSVVPCDNLSHNGQVVRRVVLDAAADVDPALVDWVEQHVSFVTTMVDRITPRTTDEDRAAVAAATGLHDASPVVTEPFAEWVISGEFPAGRPAWEGAGAVFVDDVTPFEMRKLLLLNGAHSLLAYGASLRGHETVADAMGDPTCRSWVAQWWDDAERHVPLPRTSTTAYRSALEERFDNPAIRHLLAQIAADGSQKLPVRIAPVLRAERAAGRVPLGAVRVVAAWLLHLRGNGAPVDDVGAQSLLSQVRGDLPEASTRTLAAVAPDLADDRELARAVAAAARELAS